MADPFMLMNRALGRGGYGGSVVKGTRSSGSYVEAGYGGRKKKLDPSNPADIEYLRRMHPDFDEVMSSADIDYKTRCQTDPDFSSKFQIPPVIEPTRVFREHTNSVDAVCWGPEPGQFVSASHDKTLKVWEARSGRCLETLHGHSGGIYHCAVASNRKLVASCGSGAESNLLLWQWAHKKSSMALTGHRRSVIHVTFSPDSQCTSSVDQDGNLLLHDLATGKVTLQRSLHFGTALGSSFCKEDGNLLCTAGFDGFIRVLDLREQACPAPAWRFPSTAANWSSPAGAGPGAGRSLGDAHGGYPVHAVEFTGPSTIISGGADHKLKRWDLRMLSAGPAAEYLGHSAAIRSLCASGDGRFIVSGCEDGSCRVWHQDARSTLKTSLQGLRDEVQNLETQLQDASTPAQARRDLESRQQELREKMATDKAALDHQKRDGYSEAVKTLGGHVSQVSSCAWQEDGKGSVSILSSSWDQTVQLFDVRLQEFA